MIAAATPTDALAGGLVVLAVFIAGLYWQEETRALREMTQRIRTFTIALVAVLSEFERSEESTSDARTLMPLVPGGLSTVIRCRRSCWKSGWTWASIIVLVLAVGVAVSGGDAFDGYLAVLLLVVVLALAMGHVARVPQYKKATDAARTMRSRVEEALSEGRVQGLLGALLRQVAKELAEAGCDDLTVQSTYSLELQEELEDHMVHVAEVRDASDDLYASLKFGEWTSPPLKMSGSPDQLPAGTRVLVFLGGKLGKPNRVAGIVDHTSLVRANSRLAPVTKQGADASVWNGETLIAFELLRSLWNGKAEQADISQCDVLSALSHLEATMGEQDGIPRQS